MIGESREVELERPARHGEGLLNCLVDPVLSVDGGGLLACLESRIVFGRVKCSMRSVIALIPSIVSEYASGSF